MELMDPTTWTTIMDLGNAGFWYLAWPAIIAIITLWGAYRADNAKENSFGEGLGIVTFIIPLIVSLLALFLTFLKGVPDAQWQIVFEQTLMYLGFMLSALVTTIAWRNLVKLLTWALKQIAAAGNVALVKPLRALATMASNALNAKLDAFANRDKAIMAKARKFAAELNDALPAEGFDAERKMIDEVLDDLLPGLLELRHRLRADIVATQRDLERYDPKTAQGGLLEKLKRTIRNIERFEELLRQADAEVQECLDWLDLAESELRLAQRDAEYTHGEIGRQFARLTERVRATTAQQSEARADARSDEMSQRAIADAEVDSAGSTEDALARVRRKAAARQKQGG